MFFSQKLNNFASQVPVYPNGARISSPRLAATIDCLANLRPDTLSIIFFPLDARAYSLYKYVSMPDSST